MDKIVLIHLSDIHFTHSSGEALDLDADVRNELRRDSIQLSKRIGPIAGVLVTGDIAFGGQKEEYERATDWLKDFCHAVGCPEESVWVVPGNHDVDRDLAKDIITKMIHDTFRDGDETEIDSNLVKFFSNSQSANALLAPLGEYNAFAAPFECQVSATAPYWQSDLLLTCGTVIRMRGLCSAFVSNEHDEKGKIILGTAQASVPRQEGVLYLTLCHHPPDWLRDQDTVEAHLRSKVHIQLFGHKHAQRVDNINGNARLVAGAMHPERRERSWVPTFNLLEIERLDARSICLRLYQRRWNQPETCFSPDPEPRTGREYREYVWAIEAPSPLAAERVSPPVSSPTPDPPSGIPYADTSIGTAEVQLNPDYARRLTYRFLSLPSLIRYEIALKLGLLREEDDLLSRDAMFLEAFKRAVHSQQLGMLWDETERHHKDPSNHNPFLVTKQPKGDAHA